MKKKFSIQGAAAITLISLGGMVMIGWLLRNAAMIRLHPDFVGMVFNTALGLALVGTALLLQKFTFRRGAAVQAALAWLLIAIAAATLLEYITGITLFIDLPSVHAWLNDGNLRPGRMAPNAAFAFLTCGVILLMMRQVRSRAAGIALQSATFIVLMLGMIGLSTYLLRLDLLYAWFPAVRMAPHTAGGLIAAALGLWSSWRGAEWYRTQLYFKEDEKTGYVGATILAVIAMTAGVVGFSVQQATLEKTFSQSLQAMLRNQTMLFQSVIKQSAANAEHVGRAPYLAPLVRLLGSPQPLSPDAAMQVKTIAQDIFASGFSGIAIYDRNDREILRLGRAANVPEIETDLGMSPSASLFWDGELFLRSRTTLQDRGETVGALVIEQALTPLTQQLDNTEGLGATGEMGMCVRRLDELTCFPQRRMPHVYTFHRQSSNGKLTPMSYAVEGLSGIFQGRDFRGNYVIAAYGPLTANGLGMVVKQDADELFQPIRVQFHWYGLLLILLVGAGALLLRSQVTPMVSKVLASERKALESEARTREIMETLGEGVFVANQHGTILFTNPAAQQMLGWSEQEMLGQNQHSLFHHTRADGRPYPASACEISKVVHTGRSFHAHDEAFWRKDGSMLPVSVNAAPIMRQGLVVGAVVAFHDIVQRQKAQQALESESAKNATLLRTASDGIHVLDPQGNVVQANDAFCRMLGYTQEELLNMNVTQWDVQWSDSELHKRIEQQLSMERPFKEELFETRHRRRDGSMIDVEVHACAVVIDGKALLYASARDISERKKAAEQVHHLAHFDLLTDLPNRALLSDRLQQALVAAKRNETHMALMFIDLDKFKPVNDSLGHHIGDLLLQAVAQRLQDCLRASDSVARVGGDEFVVLLPRIEVAQDAMTVAEKILQSVSAPFELERHVIHISASIGVASYPEHGSDQEQLLKNADDAMYHAKEAGGAAIVWFGQMESVSS